MALWFRIRDVEQARAFYAGPLGFQVVEYDAGRGWLRVARDGVEISFSVADDDEAAGVAQLEVEDVKGEAERLRAAGVNVGVVVELHGAIRLVDVTDPDGNVVQLTQEL